MGENTKIEWATHSWNPWVGCTKISPACDHCYAEGWAKRTGQAQLWNGERRRTSVANWAKPLKWNAALNMTGQRQRVFCASLADVFDNQADPLWRADLFLLIKATPNLDWLLLTKRPQNIRKMLPADWREGYPNVWLGTTCENQEEADRRIPELLANPARIHFLSCEPLLGPIDFSMILVEHPAYENYAPAYLDALSGEVFDAGGSSLEQRDGIDWVIAGGESGPGARTMHPDWLISLRDQCAAAGVAFFFKQWGEFEVDQIGPEDPRSLHYPPNHIIYRKVGKAKAGRKLDGQIHDGLPA
jgi:protein gp37